MKLRNLFTLAVLIFAGTALMQAQTKYTADTEASIINWKGFKPTGDHYGTVLLGDGNFVLNQKEIVGGEFKIDMNTIVNLDMPADNEYNAKLVKHLKSDDFFGVQKHPYAKFVITSTEKKGDQVMINGQLTIKEITHPVSFPAVISHDGDQLRVKSDVFKIDRSKWNVKFKSKSFFDDLADNFIYDDMEMSIDIKSKK